MCISCLTAARNERITGGYTKWQNCLKYIQNQHSSPPSLLQPGLSHHRFSPSNWNHLLINLLTSSLVLLLTAARESLLKLNSDHVTPLLTAPYPHQWLLSQCKIQCPYNGLHGPRDVVPLLLRPHLLLLPPPCLLHFSYTWPACSSSNMLYTFSLQGFVLTVHSAWNALSSYIHIGSLSHLFRSLCKSHFLGGGYPDDPNVHSSNSCPSTLTPLYPLLLFHFFL